MSMMKSDAMVDCYWTQVYCIVKSLVANDCKSYGGRVNDSKERYVEIHLLSSCAHWRHTCACRHAQDVRELYERKLERANNLYMELCACMLQMEKRERELAKLVSLCLVVYLFIIFFTNLLHAFSPSFTIPSYINSLPTTLLLQLEQWVWTVCVCVITVRNHFWTELNLIFGMSVYLESACQN